MISLIDLHGIRNALKMIDDKKDAYALVTYDKVTRTVTFVRNKQRSLYFSVNENTSVLYYASEVGFLQAALSRRGIKHSPVYIFEPNTAYFFDPARIKKHDGKVAFRYVDLNPEPETPKEAATGTSDATAKEPPFDV